MTSSRNHLRNVLRIVLPLAVVGGALLLARWISAGAERPIVEAPPVVEPPVRIAIAVAEDVRLDVEAYGTVEPLRTVELAAQVGGRVVATSDALRPGGTFAKGEVLLRIERADYELAVVQQEAAVARAELRLMQERAEADAALRAWRGLEGEAKADPLVLREPQLEDAKMAVAAARAALEKARLDLSRTEVSLPFAGRVRSVAADVGQTVQPAQPLAVVLDTSAVEVRLPVPVDQAAFVDLPLHGRTDNGPRVELGADFAGERHTWHGMVVRTEGELDRRTRQLTVVARVEPGQNGERAVEAPLLVGTFVTARISGTLHRDVVVVPRAALRAGDVVWVVAPRVGALPAAPLQVRYELERRRVDVLRADRDRVVLRAGVRAGELVSLTDLDAPSDGMRVRIAGGPRAGGDRAREGR